MRLLNRNGSWFILVLAAVTLSYYLFTQTQSKDNKTYKISAGSLKGKRSKIASVIVKEGHKNGLNLELIGSTGSVDAAKKLSKGELDFALIQGGISTFTNIMQLASLSNEPLHILVKPELAGQSITALKGKMLNLSTTGSGTNQISTELLKFAGVYEGDYIPSRFSYSKINSLPENYPLDSLPDAFFSVSSLKSSQAEILVNMFGYKLMGVDFVEAFALQKFAVHEFVIPRYTYGVSSMVPDKDLPTVGTQLLLLCNNSVSNEAAEKMLQTIYGSEFGRQTKFENLEQASLEGILEYPAHDAFLRHVSRKDPLFTSEMYLYVRRYWLFAGSIFVVVLVLSRWYVNNRRQGFGPFLKKLRGIDQTFFMNENKDRRFYEELLLQLNVAKTEALERYSSGEIEGTGAFAGFMQYYLDLRMSISEKIKQIPKTATDTPAKSETIREVEDIDDFLEGRVEWKARPLSRPRGNELTKESLEESKKSDLD